MQITSYFSELLHVFNTIYSIPTPCGHWTSWMGLKQIIWTLSHRAPHFESFITFQCFQHTTQTSFPSCTPPAWDQQTLYQLSTNKHLPKDQQTLTQNLSILVPLDHYIPILLYAYCHQIHLLQHTSSSCPSSWELKCKCACPMHFKKTKDIKGENMGW